MGSGGSFVEADRKAAAAFGRAARAAGVRRLVYLGGLGEGELSEHLASRQEVGRILRESGVPTVEFRCSIVIGSGSASFEMLRALVERLPVMVTPRWVTTRTQPIAIEDVISYLVAALDYEPDGGEVFEIGGADVCSYLDLMHEYADQRGLRRQMVPVPVLTPRLSSLWLHLVTPGVRGDRARARRQPAQRDCRQRSPGARCLPGAAADIGRGGRQGARERGQRGRGDPLVGRGTCSEPGLRWCPLRLAARRLAQHHAPSSPRGDVRAYPADRRRQRLVRPRRRSGNSAAPSTHSSADPAFGAGAATRSASRSGTRSTSGASRSSSRTVCYGSPQR